MAFDARAFLATAGGAKTVRDYGRSETIFTPGDVSDNILYIQSGGVRLSAVSKAGKIAEVATLGPGEFFGEGCLAGQSLRTGSATAITPTTILFISKQRMAALLHRQRGMSDRFISHMLSRNIRIEEDLVVQLFDADPSAGRIQGRRYRRDNIGSSLAARRAGR
jgi:CRP/FNR family cyclic AMP-dependent transcriptional regulator